MELIKIAMLAFFSYISLFVLTKIMGNRQMSQLSMFDYINGITIGSIAAEMATNLENYQKPLVAMVVYGILETLMAVITYKSIKIRRLVNGSSVILLENGKLYERNLKKVRMDVGEFLTQCRTNGYFDLSNIHKAFFETNGQISFLPVTTNRPVSPQDLNLSPTQEMPCANVIMDGNIMKKNLQHTGNNEKWLLKQLSLQGVSEIKDVFLATCSTENKLTVYVKLKEQVNVDIFE